MQCQAFFERLWQEYIAITPQAQRIHQLFLDDGNTIINDHVAFRSFALAPIAIADLEPLLLSLGYSFFDSYQFVEKKLNARAYVNEDALQPRVFLSELKVDELSDQAQVIIQRLCLQVDSEELEDVSAFSRGRLWSMPSWQDYQCLCQESEYAAWMSVFGLRANHFTISVNHLQKPQLSYVLNTLHKAGIALNQLGGEIKGSEDDLLQQSATLADEIDINFADGDSHTIASCYYEFALRYKDKQGQLYQGFVPANDNNIFHSTDRQSH